MVDGRKHHGGATLSDLKLQLASPCRERLSTSFEQLEVGATFHSELIGAHDSSKILCASRPNAIRQLQHINEETRREALRAGEIFTCVFHTLAISQNLAHEFGFFEILPVVGLGISDIRMPKPVLVGDSVRVRVTVQEQRPSNFYPGQGVVTNLTELINQDDEVVLSFSVSELVRMRP